jgi:hypothetical protein
MLHLHPISSVSLAYRTVGATDRETIRAPAYRYGSPFLDLNHLLFRHQVSLMRADAAASPEARHSHRGLAAGYAARVLVLQPDFRLAAGLHA